MITRRDFIKGMGALALIPFIPEMVKPTEYCSNCKKHVETALRSIPGTGGRWTGTCCSECGWMLTQRIFEPEWNNTGTMTIPTREGRYKVRYTVHPDRTDAEIVGVE
jgi:hypothetical protein